MTSPRVTAPATVDVSLIDLDDAVWDCPVLLDLRSLERARRLRRARLRRRFVAAHAGLATILADYVGVDPRSLRFAVDACPLCGAEHGKPILLDARTVHFSLSHSNGLGAVAVSQSVDVGIDVEHVDQAIDDIVGLARVALSPVELASLDQLSGPSARFAFYRQWVRKEALLKGKGSGLGVDPTDIQLTLDATHQRWRDWIVRDIGMPANYVGAVATRGEAKVEIRAPEQTSAEQRTRDAACDTQRRRACMAIRYPEALDWRPDGV